MTSIKEYVDALDESTYQYYKTTPFQELMDINEKLVKQEILRREFYGVNEGAIVDHIRNMWDTNIGWASNLGRDYIERPAVIEKLSSAPGKDITVKTFKWITTTKDAMGETYDSMSDGYQYIYNSTASAIKSCSDALSNFANGMATLKNNFLDSASKTITWLGDAAESSVNGGRDIWRVFSRVPEIAERYKNALWEFKKEKIESIYKGFGAAYEGIVNKADQAVDMVKDAWNTAIKSPTQHAGKVFDKGTGVAGSIGQDISDAGDWISERTPEPIKRGLSSVGNSIGRGWNNLMVKIGLREPEVDYMVYGKYAIGSFLAVAAIVTIWKLIQRYINEDGTIKSKDQANNLSNVTEGIYNDYYIKVINENNVNDEINKITGDYTEKEAMKISVAQDKKILAEKYSSPSFMARMLDGMVKNLLNQQKFINYMKRSSPELLETLNSYNNKPLTESIEEISDNLIMFNNDKKDISIDIDKQLNFILENSSAFNYYINTPINKLSNNHERIIKQKLIDLLKEQRLNNNQYL